MRIIEHQTRIDGKDCVKFINRRRINNTIKSYIQILNDKDIKNCYSNIGRIGGSQKLSLYFNEPYNCVKQHLVIHELMHSLGFPHEQSKPDRVKWVEIFRENINESKIMDSFFMR